MPKLWTSLGTKSGNALHAVSDEDPPRMLTRLSIRNVVLIDALDLEWGAGLSVLTGETGAGKSILLDALGLALGLRAEAGLLRKGTEQASATAVFNVPVDHAARALAVENGLEVDPREELLLRRVLGDDGRTRAFVNDQPVSIGLLKRIGELLVEIHGQFETQRLLDPAGHRDLLDAYAGHDDLLADVAALHNKWRSLRASLSAAEEAAQLAAENEDHLRYAVGELRALDPQPGEESALAEKRKILQHSEQISTAMREAVDALAGDDGAEVRLSQALTALERVQDKAGGLLDHSVGALSRAVSEAADATGFLERAGEDLNVDPEALEAAEARLFALRALARKYNTEVDRLADVMAKLVRDLEGLESGSANLARLRRETKDALVNFAQKAEALRNSRTKAAGKLDKAMAKELAPLKLGTAHFVTNLEALDEDKWAQHGMDRVAFAVATNPGAAAGPLNKIASGGELARFMLALKVVLAEADPVPVLVFDEVDAGIGGAVAAAVGERLARLGESVQVCVVTHSPQVAARGRQHLNVRKAVDAKTAKTEVVTLTDDARREEIARMLSGEEVTGEARAAADSLLKGNAA